MPCRTLPERRARWEELRKAIAVHERAAAGAFREVGSRVVAKLKSAEMAFHEVAHGEFFAPGAAEIVQDGSEQDDAEAEAGIDKQQFVEFEAEHRGLARGL
jgi:hypothetical protein